MLAYSNVQQIAYYGNSLSCSSHPLYQKNYAILIFVKINLLSSFSQCHQLLVLSSILVFSLLVLLVSLVILMGLIRLRKLGRVVFMECIRNVQRKLLYVAAEIKGVIMVVTCDSPMTNILLGLDRAQGEYSVLTVINQIIGSRIISMAVIMRRVLCSGFRALKDVLTPS